MQRYFDVVQDRSGNAIAGASVSVYVGSTSNLATIYSDNGVTLTANPLTTNGDGEYAFYAANGTYTLTIEATNYSSENKPGTVLFDPADSVSLATGSVNYLNVLGGNTLQPAVVSALGGDASIGLALRPKGSGAILAQDSAGLTVAELGSTGSRFPRVAYSPFVSLTDQASILLNGSLGNSFIVTLAGNRTLANPSNLTDGAVYNIWIKQDATGGRTLTYGSKFKWPGGVAPSLTTAANALDFMSCQYNLAQDILVCVMQNDVK